MIRVEDQFRWALFYRSPHRFNVAIGGEADIGPAIGNMPSLTRF